jgi:hypothetical protein
MISNFIFVISLNISLKLTSIKSIISIVDITKFEPRARLLHATTYSNDGEALR